MKNEIVVNKNLTMNINLEKNTIIFKGFEQLNDNIIVEFESNDIKVLHYVIRQFKEDYITNWDFQYFINLSFRNIQFTVNTKEV